MRILYVIPYYAPASGFGGPLTACRAVAEDMVERGHEVRVLTTDCASRSARLLVASETLGGVAVTRVRNVSQTLVGRANIYTPRGFARRVRAALPTTDVLHVHEFFNWPSMIAIRAAAHARVPVLLSGHGGISLDPRRGRLLSKRILFALLGRHALAQCSAIQAASEAEATTLRGLGVPEGRVHLIPNGVPFPPLAGDRDRFRTRHGLGQRVVFLFVGRLATGKGVDLLLQARPFGRADGPVAVLVGPPENRPDLSPGWRGPNLLLTGPLAGTDLADAYAAADLFVLPSFAEGQPLTAIEAMSHGLPVLLSTACNLPEVEAAGVGWTCAPDLGAVERAIDHTLADRSSWSARSSAARKLVAERFDLRRIHDAYETLYRRIADHG